MNSPEDEIPLPSVGVLSEEETSKQLREDACIKFDGYAAGKSRILELEKQLQASSEALMRCQQFKRIYLVELYQLVEAYLCTPNTAPAVKDAYDNLVAWFVRNKRPDGTEPRPVSPEQQQ